MDAQMFNTLQEQSDNFNSRFEQLNNMDISNHLNGVMSSNIGKQIHKTAEDQINNLLGTSGAEVAGIAAHMAYRGYKYGKALNAQNNKVDTGESIDSKGNVLSKEEQLTNIRNMLAKSASGRQRLADTKFDEDPKNFPDNVGFEAAPPKSSSAKFVATVTKGIQTRGAGGEGIGGGGGDFNTSRYRYDPQQGRMVSRETGEPVTEVQVRQGSSERQAVPETVDPEGDLPFGLTPQTRSMLDTISQSGSMADKVDLFQQREPVFQPPPKPVAAEPISTQTEQTEDVFGNPLPAPAVAAEPSPVGTYRRGGTSLGSTPFRVAAQGTQPQQPIERPPTPARAQESLVAPKEPAPTLTQDSLQRAVQPVARSNVSDSNPESSLSFLEGGEGGRLAAGLDTLGIASAAVEGGKNEGANVAKAVGTTALDFVAPGAGAVLGTAETLGDSALSAGQKAKSIAKSVGTVGAVEGAEALLPGAGEILMGLTAVGGLIADLVEKGKEKAPAPPPPMPQAPQVGIVSSRPLDSSQYRGVLGGLQQ